MARKTKPTNGVWCMELWKFGYCLRVVANTEDECLQAMQDEYIKTYAMRNGLEESKCRDALLSPILDEDGEVDEYDEYNEFAQYYRDAFEDPDIRYYEFGKVVWE